MVPAVTMVLERAIASSRAYTLGRSWKLAILCEVSSRGPRPYFGLDRFPTAVESLAAAGDNL